MSSRIVTNTFSKKKIFWQRDIENKIFAVRSVVKSYLLYIFIKKSQ